MEEERGVIERKRIRRRPDPLKVMQILLKCLPGLDGKGSVFEKLNFFYYFLALD